MTIYPYFSPTISLALDRVILQLEQRQAAPHRDSYRRVKAQLERAVPACKAGTR